MEEKPSREELRRRLKEKRSKARGAATPRVPDVASLALHTGVDDARFLNMAMGMAKKNPSMSTVRDMMAHAMTREADSEDEQPPPASPCRPVDADASGDEAPPPLPQA